MRGTVQDLASSLWLIVITLMVASAVVWLLPSQAEPGPMHNGQPCSYDQDGEPGVPPCPAQNDDQPAQNDGLCVEIGLSYRGLPQCNGLEPGQVKG